MCNEFYDFANLISQLKTQHLYRERRTADGPQGAVRLVDGRRVLNFCSNDYLGLANHAEVCLAFKKAVDRYGVGSGAAHLLSGHSHTHHELEEELAAFTGREKALLFSTGYMANIGVISALLNRNGTVFQDRLNHASLVDGGLLSRARIQRYRHVDVGDLRRWLTGCTTKKMIVSDGVFSMDGDLAPLPELVELAREYGSGLMVDDAHGFGVLGEHGGGTVQHFGLSQDDVPILIGTLGKAFGTFGAFVAGSENLIEALIQKARTYLFTTAMPPALAEATRTSLRLLQHESWRREKLRGLLSRFRSGAEQLGLRLLDSPTAIQPILIGDSLQTSMAGDRLLELGVWVGVVRPPTVPEGTARLRIAFSAYHEEWQVDTLLDALSEAVV